MDANLDKTLLAFLLALYQLEPKLTDDELYALDELGEALDDEWVGEELNFIADIEAIAAANPTLNQLYQEALTKLAPLNPDQLYQALPSPDRVEELLGVSGTSKGYVPEGKATQQTNEVVNLSRMVMRRDRPEKDVKKIAELGRYWEIPPVPMF
jgi:hypothetical protein